jgi:hypothetical protein
MYIVCIFKQQRQLVWLTITISNHKVKTINVFSIYRYNKIKYELCNVYIFHHITDQKKCKNLE